MPLLALFNPISGDGTAESFLRNRIIPVLLKGGKIVDQISATQSATHAGQLVIDFMKKNTSRDGEITVVLCSGDGTLHDIVNALYVYDEASSPLATHLNFVLVPCGTANALFVSLFPPETSSQPDDIHKLKSLHAYINNQSSKSTPLVIAQTSQIREQSVLNVVIAVVVVSTSLHASILKDSEMLRKAMPGIERFKVAARNNATKWFKSRVKLSPGASIPVVQLYDPDTKAFITHPSSTNTDSTVYLEGPFSYFLSTVNVDRLEPKFQITSLARGLPPVGASCDVVIIRPLRDPSIYHDDPEARSLFAPKIWAVLGSAYEGRHVDLRYEDNGEIGMNGNGPTVVEYIRCGSWEWIPENKGVEPDANLLCSDGDISRIESGGRVVCSVISPGCGTTLYTVST